jgi:hypothetical protein
VDLCLFTSFSQSSELEAFQKAFEFCIKAPSNSKLISAMKNISSITNADIAIILNVLKKNRDNYKLSQQQQPKKGRFAHIYAVASHLSNLYILDVMDTL